MNESSTQNMEFRNRKLLVRRHVDRAALLRRVTVAAFLAYYIWILTSAFSMGGWWWSPEEGLMWVSTIPGRFLPIPAPPEGYGVLSYGYPIDQVFYLVFMHGGIWIAWIALGLLYLFSPYRIDLRLLHDRVRTRLHDRG
jgi:hypothetical protein